MEKVLNMYKLTMENCQRKIAMGHIEEISRKCCKNWRSLPAYLDLEEIIVNDIDHKQQDECGKRHSFLLQWGEEKGAEATYKKLIFALLKINRRSDAEKICEIIATSRDPSTATAQEPSATGT